jgi:hypothetical protein
MGDVSTLVTKSDDGLDLSNLSDAELEKKLAQFDTKERVFRGA